MSLISVFSKAYNFNDNFFFNDALGDYDYRIMYVTYFIVSDSSRNLKELILINKIRNNIGEGKTVLFTNDTTLTVYGRSVVDLEECHFIIN